MDDEHRQAYAALMKEIHGVSSDVRANTSLTAELSRDIASIKTETGALRGDVKVLQKAVFGSEPPPAPPLESIVRQVSEHDGDIATLTGQVIATRAEVAETKRQNEELLELARAILKTLGNPWLKRVAYAIGTIIVGYATAKGFLK